MTIQHNVSLSDHSTMRLGGLAAHLTEVTSREEIIAAVNWADEQQLPVIMIGSGSNIVWRDEGYPGLVLVNKIGGVEITGDQTDKFIRAGSGLIWDNLVAQTVELGLTGIECLSLIPGTVGATPIQNVGAYGQEVANSIMTIEAYDHQTKQLVNLRASECNFGYRTSRFKTSDKGRFFITAVTFYLTVGKPALPYYDAVQRYFTEHQITEVNPKVMREAVIAIRQAKLPDPAKVANCGSFFANPIISSDDFFPLLSEHPEISYWRTDDDQIKLSAAWLIEQAGFKGSRDTETGISTWPNQPLVLINQSAKTTAQLLAYKQQIVDAVHSKFGITLTQEPELLP